MTEIDLTYKRPNGEVRLASAGAHILSGRKSALIEWIKSQILQVTVPEIKAW